MADIMGSQTIADAWDAAARTFGDRPFLVHLDGTGGRSEFTYREFADRIHQSAHAFRHLGVQVGEPVLLQVGNTPAFLSALFGLVELGAIAVPVGVTATRPELVRGYAACGSRWAVIQSDRLGDHHAARREGSVVGGGLLVVGGPRTELPSAAGPPSQAVLSYESVCADQPAEPGPRAPVTSDDVAEILFTSGTTAAPKGVMITHANVLFAGHYGIWQTSLRGDDRIFATMPACHSNFQLAALAPVLVAGATLIMGERYSASRFWATAREEGATVVQLIAMMVRTLLLQPPSDEDTRHQVREAPCFMPLSDRDKDEFERRFGVRLMNSYGSTESIGWAVTDPPQGERRWPSVGRAGLGYEVDVFDSSGRVLPPGEVGEFRIKGVPGRSLTPGYWNDPDATAAALTEGGWLRTHDQGFRDDAGWFYFVDRDKNLIKRAGENISSTEVECALTAHPLIAEAAVIGVPDPVRDHAVKAFVRLVPGAVLGCAQIAAHCATRLASYKIPEVIELVDDFPRTESMKIEKRLLT